MRALVSCLFVGQRAHFFASFLILIPLLIPLLILLPFPLLQSSWTKRKTAHYIGSFLCGVCFLL